MRTMSAARMGVLSGVLGSGIASAMAGQFFPDQQNLTSISSAWSAVHLAPVGQEFIPTTTSMNGVELLLSNTDAMSPLPATLSVRVREGAVTGSVLGTSVARTLGFGVSGVVHFDFTTFVSLTPGVTHVLEIVVSPGGGNVSVSAGGSGDYSAGRAIVLGEPLPSSDFSDLWFSEGSSHGRRRRSK